MKNLPWLIDQQKLQEDRENVHSDLDIEIGSLFLLAENLRAGPGKITKKAKKSKVELIMKLGWPMWLLKTEEDHGIFLDGLNMPKEYILDKIKVNFNNLKSTIDELSPEDLLNKLPEVETSTITPDENKLLEGILPKDIFTGIKKLIKYEDSETSFTVSLPYLLKEDSAIDINGYIKNYENHVNGIFNEASDIISFFETKKTKIANEIENRIKSINDEYDGKYNVLEQEVNNTIAPFPDEEKSEIEAINTVRLNEDNNLIQVIKDSLSTFSPNITLIVDDWNQNYEKITGSSQKEEISNEFGNAITQLRKDLEVLNTKVIEIDTGTISKLKSFDNIQESYDIKEKAIKDKFEQRKQDELKKLEVLSEERTQKIQDENSLKSKIDTKLNTCISNMQQFANRKEEKLVFLENYKTKFEFSDEDIVKFQIPVYYIKINDFGRPITVLIPPLNIGTGPLKKSNPLSYNQKVVPLLVSDESFLKFFDESFKLVLNLNPEINDLLDESSKSETYNLLLSSKYKEQAIKGITFIKGRALGKTKDIDKLAKEIKNF